MEEKCHGPWSIRPSETPNVTDLLSPQGRQLLQDLHVFSSSVTLSATLMAERDVGKDQGGVKPLRAEDFDPRRNGDHLARNTRQIEIRNGFVDIRGALGWTFSL